MREPDRAMWWRDGVVVGWEEGVSAWVGEGWGGVGGVSCWLASMGVGWWYESDG